MLGLSCKKKITVRMSGALESRASSSLPWRFLNSCFEICGLLLNVRDVHRKPSTFAVKLK